MSVGCANCHVVETETVLGRLICKKVDESEALQLLIFLKY